ncbi:response regulator [Flavitalea sp. BT771]|uniref:response regulator n=1 Tax=Flavitalea sp. BT771 TaxID=3063329 RepID=UPI0026E2C71C|nr:response regulator [Flavitalea sp. BT771]MDO6435013.1 response regulator [Flavitalea sp. BT771]MDV6223913.1 response regulator [Flavitalea sp. BT771]
MKYTNILLVDDDMDDRMLFQQTLEEIDPAIRVHDVENGLDMVDWLNNCSDNDLPDLVILDQIMPKMTGKESLIFLKETPRYKYIPVILYSTFQMKDFLHSCRELGALDVVAKPDTIQAYRNMIEQFILAV